MDSEILKDRLLNDFSVGDIVTLSGGTNRGIVTRIFKNYKGKMVASVRWDSGKVNTYYGDELEKEGRRYD